MDTSATNGLPQLILDGNGATILGPRNVPLERENPSLFASPVNDAGTMPNLKFSFASARNRLLTGGWAREVTARELPVATTLAGVNMRLKPGGIRKLHWHKDAEWAYMLAGRARITAVDQDGFNFIDDVDIGDIWNFPAGIPHSIQGLEDGCEFLLIFDNGAFSQNETIFPGPVPPALAGDDAVHSPAGPVPSTFSHRLQEQEPIVAAGGRVRIVDSSNFPAATTIAAAEVEVEPGAMREMHWHPNTDEWQYYISGQGRMTVFAAAGKARTFDFAAGDVGYIPFAMGHYVENTGDKPLRFLEVFRSDRFADVSLSQVDGAHAPELVQPHATSTPQR
jgi:oxalate decarboxylase